MENGVSMEILYDGNCPICRRKVSFLQKRDKNERLSFSDIRNPEFNCMESGRSIAELEKQIHAILIDGAVIHRMDVIRAAYREIGLGWLVKPTGWPILRPLFDNLYGFIAKHRLSISRFFS